MSTSNPNKYIQLLVKERVENLKRELRNSQLMLMAVMDEMQVTEIPVSAYSLFTAEGSIEIGDYDINTNTYKIMRIKPEGGEDIERLEEGQEKT